MPPTMTYSETLVVTHCWCGIAVAIPENLFDWMQRKEGNSCRCPVGHTFVFNNTLEEQLEKTKQQLESERRRVTATRDLLHHEERSHAATRGHLTRHRKRSAAGVCPCCNRTFQNVARHMKSKHPEFAPEAE